MKKMTLVLSALSFFALASTALAQGSGQGFVPLAPIQGLTDAGALSVAASSNLPNFFNNLYKYAIGLAAVLAVIQIIWAGLNIALHQDSVSSITDSKGKIYNALFGLVLVLSPVLVFSIINPNILNLSLKLPELNRAAPSTTPVTSGAGAPAPTIDTATGCSVTGTLFQKATCSTQQAATDWAAKCSGFLGGKVSACKQENASGCADSAYYAVCETSAALANYMFLDISSPYIPYDSFSDFRPLASSPSNPNNGADVIKFAATCSQDGGMTCLSSLTTLISTSCAGSYTTPQPTSQSNKCYNMQVSCEDASFLNTKINLCKSNPAWSPIK
jgi:hypothetical protein